MDKIVNATKEQGENLDITIGHRNFKPVRLSNLLYTDNVVLILKSKNKVQKLINL